MAILNLTSKNTLFFLLRLCLLFNKISNEGRQVLPGSEGGWEGVGGGRGQGREMTQTMYACVNKWIIIIKNIPDKGQGLHPR
jgi:hypothetical protein